MAVLATWLGHASVLLRFGAEPNGPASTAVLTDPVLTRRVAHLHRRRGPAPHDVGGERLLDPDVVLLSHLHADHTHLPSLRMLAPGTTVVVPRGAVDGFPALRRWARRRGQRIVELDVGEVYRVGGGRRGAGGGPVEVTAVPAVHDGRRLRKGPPVPALGYLIRADADSTSGGGGATAYFAGDTDVYPEMGRHIVEPDLALLPVGGWGPTLGAGHMDSVRAVRAAELIGARLSVPIHFGTLWPMGMASVRPEWFFDPGADFVRIAAEAGLAARELVPGGEIRVG